MPKRAAVSKSVFFFFIARVFSTLLISGCGCGDDDDDSGSGNGVPDDDTTADDDTSLPDDSADDDSDDDTVVDPPPVVHCVPPVDYDGDGDNDLLMLSYVAPYLHVYLVSTDDLTTREEIFRFGTGKQGGPGVRVADFDRNGVWDFFIFNTYNADKAVETVYEVYMNGNFTEPAYQSEPYPVMGIDSRIIDTDGDGFPELLLKTGENLSFIIIDPQEDFAQTAAIENDAEEYRFLETTRPGEIFPYAGNVTGDEGAHELPFFTSYQDGDIVFLQILIFNAADGSLKVSSDPIDVGQGGGYSDASAADFDGDGLIETFITVTYYMLAPYELHSGFVILGGSTLESEFSTAEYDLEYSHITNSTDFNGDGVIDPYAVHTPSGWTQYSDIYDGTAAYASMFSYERPSDSQGDFAFRKGRGELNYAYSFTDPGQYEMVMVRELRGASETTGEIEVLNTAGGASSGVLNTIPLGGQGQTDADVIDLENDGNMELVVMAEEVTWVVSEYVYNYVLYVFSSPDMELIYSDNLGNGDYDYQLMTQFDMNNDWAPDILVQKVKYSKGAYEMYYYLYLCSGGICEKQTLDTWSGEDRWFAGPML